MIPIARLRLVWVTAYESGPDDASIEADAWHAEALGARTAWLRQPAWNTRERLRAVGVLRRRGWTVIVGRDVTAAAEADGMQCGLDGPFPASPVPFGISVHAPEEAAIAASRGASWLVAGPVRTTRKEGGPVAGRGLDWLRRVTALTSLPVVGVGGLGPDDVDEVVAAGAVGIAGISAFRRR